MKNIKIPILFAVVFAAMCMALPGCSSNKSSAAAESWEPSLTASMEVNSASTSEEPAESAASDKLDAADYITGGWSVLIDKLNMKETEARLLANSNAYEIDGFYLEWSSNNECSMISSEKGDVVAAGVEVGDSLEEDDKKLKDAGWINFGEEGSMGGNYGIVLEDQDIMLELESDGDTVQSWFIGNWPQGDFDYDKLR